MKIWLDDIRAPPDQTWTICRKAEEAIDLIVKHKHEIFEISFDHDLGEGKNGNHVARVIELLIEKGDLIRVPKWSIHSANPVGADNIRSTMLSATNLSKRNKHEPS